jgi:hypothetical protein
MRRSLALNLSQAIGPRPSQKPSMVRDAGSTPARRHRRI